jgi:hypothetical protein
VQCGGVHPDWFDGQQGCSQLSTNIYILDTTDLLMKGFDTVVNFLFEKYLGKNFDNLFKADNVFTL